MYRAVSPCGSRCSFSLSWFHDLSKISVLFGSVDASVEGLSRQWMEQTLRPHSPLRVPMNLTSTTFGIRCWDCSATHMMAYSWKHFWMRWIWEESRSLLISLWVCCATKWRFIVLKEISFGTVTLGESFRWLVWLHLPAQTLLGTRVRGEPALDKWRSRTRYAARSFKYTSSGTPLPSKWPYRFGNHCHNRTCVTTGYMLGIRRGSWISSLLVVPEPSRTFNVWTAHYPPSYSYLFACSIPWWFIVSLGGSRSHQARRSHDWLLAKRFYMPGHAHRGVHVVLPTDSCLLPLPSLWYHCWSPVRHRSVPPVQNWLFFQLGQSHPCVC